MNENNQQQHAPTPMHSWGVITETDGGFNGRPAQHQKAKPTELLKAIVAAFGPGEAVSFTQETWANLHGAMSVLIEPPVQHQPQAIHQWRRVDKPELGWFDDTHERAYHADPKMEGRTLYSAEQPVQQEPVAWQRRTYTTELGWSDWKEIEDPHAPKWGMPEYTNLTYWENEVRLSYAPGMAHPGSVQIRALYTRPQAREPLTDELLRKMHHEDQFGLFCDYDEFEQIARAIEAAHGIGEKK